MNSSMSLLEIRHYIERAFLPDHCQCESPDGLNLRLTLTSHEDPSRIVTMSGNRIADVQSSRAVSELVAEGRHRLSMAVKRQPLSHSVH